MTEVDDTRHKPTAKSQVNTEKEVRAVGGATHRSITDASLQKKVINTTTSNSPKD